jgi:sterol desaturase/sphingolipid hydroxylase (fatty acid hydroxylase superfamily)
MLAGMERMPARHARLGHRHVCQNNPMSDIRRRDDRDVRASGKKTKAHRSSVAPLAIPSLVVLIGAAALLTCFEVLRPLRRPRREARIRHTGRNLAVAGLAAAAVQLVEQPIVMPVARLAERHRWGIVPRMRLPRWLETAVALIALDYTLYLWHVLVHRSPALWRFHAVHHVDLDLDASTAVRFHFGELLASVPWRAAQVALIGVGPRTLTLWQSLTLLSVLFHHSNVRLPRSIERGLGYVFVTPRMHGIHHSSESSEMNANWSSGLSVWDRIHGTLRLDVPQDRIRIGVPGYQDEKDVTLERIVTQPFRDQ